MSPTPPWSRLYYNVSLVECESSDVLDELMAIPALAKLVIRRISERVILVDGRQRTPIVRALARRGQPHRIIDGPATPPLHPGESRLP
jgi:hypothetical protein